MQNNYDIFKLLPPNFNDKLSILPKSDIFDIKIYLSKYYLELRDTLNIKDDITFGLEFEFEDAYLNRIKNELLNLNLGKNWKLKEEYTVESGGEIATPILTDKICTWQDIKKTCSMLRKHSTILNSAGAHVHIGAQILGDSKDTILNFALLWTTYENVIYRFLYGEYLNERISLLKYARSVAKQWYEDYHILKSLNNISNLEVINWLSYYDNRIVVNLCNIVSLNKKIEDNTIEFRGANGTLDPIIWQNYVNLYTKMLDYCKDKNFNKELIIDRSYKVKNDFSKLRNYRNIYLDQALEFCDLIFDNNLDKIYFLRQYLKDINSTTEKEPVKAKIFTKNEI